MMKVEYVENMVTKDLQSKGVDPRIIEQVVKGLCSEYSRGSYKGKAAALITKAIKEAIQLNKKRAKK